MKIGRVRPRQGGFALPAAIGALVIVGVLVTAGFYMARQEVRIGVASKHSVMALNIAQSGLNDVMANWTAYQFSKIAPWGAKELADTMANGYWNARIVNLNNNLWLLTATGTVTEGGALWSGASRQVALVARMIFADISPPAALTTRGKTVIQGTAFVHGEDTDPPGWTGYCSGNNQDKPGIVTNDTLQLSGTGVAGITGTPSVVQDTAVVDSTFTNFGNMEWNDLVTIAKLTGKNVTGLGGTISTVLPDSIGTVCRTTTLNNWGDPRSPLAACGAYFPLVYHAGPSLTIQSGGYGQGILLVDGNLSLRGAFVFYGLIVVQGTFETQGAGNRVMGGVMASNTDFTNQTVTGGSVVTNSTCAVERALMNNSSLGMARPLPRGWMDLSNLVS
ncbi:MAG: hypothetical protein OEZ65_04550 [Gemmatimonadota bacterium]|nr:hypothetical protein [Gemmatimonadota bacterium]MDH5758835.1 hypothetical protein [Gemmatimonadota bacterium]